MLAFCGAPPKTRRYAHISISVASENRTTGALIATMDRNPFHSSDADLDAFLGDLLLYNRLQGESTNGNTAFPELRVCSIKTCRKPLPDYPRYKMCEKCRQRSRDASRKRAARLKEAMKAGASAEGVGKDWNQLTIEERFKYYMIFLRETGKLRMNTAADSSTITGASQKTKVESSDTEYQTAALLYDTLDRELSMAFARRAGLSTKQLKREHLPNFRGCYCVVQDVSEPITKERIYLEVQRAEDLSMLKVRSDSLILCSLVAVLIIFLFRYSAKTGHQSESGF